MYYLVKQVNHRNLKFGGTKNSCCSNFTMALTINISNFMFFSDNFWIQLARVMLLVECSCTVVNFFFFVKVMDNNILKFA